MNYSLLGADPRPRLEVGTNEFYRNFRHISHKKKYSISVATSEQAKVGGQRLSFVQLYIIVEDVLRY